MYSHATGICMRTSKSAINACKCLVEICTAALRSYVRCSPKTKEPENINMYCPYVNTTGIRGGMF